MAMLCSTFGFGHTWETWEINPPASSQLAASPPRTPQTPPYTHEQRNRHQHKSMARSLGLLGRYPKNFALGASWWDSKGGPLSVTNDGRIRIDSGDNPQALPTVTSDLKETPPYTLF